VHTNNYTISHFFVDKIMQIHVFCTQPMNATASTSTPEPKTTTSWIPAYLRDLSRHCQTPIAATTAGVELFDILQLRAADPAFAAQESLAMASIRDLLLAEAIRRALGHPAPGGEKAAVKRFGSERILLRLLEFFIPEWPRTKSRAPAKVLSPTSASRAEFATAASPSFTSPEDRVVLSTDSQSAQAASSPAVPAVPALSALVPTSAPSITAPVSRPVSVPLHSPASFQPAPSSAAPAATELAELQAALKVAQERLRKVRLSGNNGPCRAADTVKDLTTRLAALSQAR
jgi:hypothetical protein